MKYEIKKILSQRYVVLLLAAAVLLNGWLFYRHCVDDSDGYTMQQIREKYSMTREALLAEREQLTERAESGGAFYDDNLLTGNIADERALDKAVLERMDEAAGYADYLDGLQETFAMQINSGMFGAEGSFSVRSLRKSQAIYEGLAWITPAISFSGGIEALSNWSLTDLFFILFGCTAALLLLTLEQQNGLLTLLRPLKKGHTSLFTQKFAAATVLTLLGFALTYGVNFAVSGCVNGYGTLDRPIQSVYGFQSCPYPMTVFGYLISFAGRKLLWGWSVCALFVLLSSLTGRTMLVMLSAAAVVATALLLGSSDRLWLRALSLTEAVDMKPPLQQCLFLNLFGRPVRQATVSLLFPVLLLVGSFGVGAMVFCKKTAIPSKKRSIFTKGSRLHRHTCLFLHEGWKIGFMNGAVLLLVLLATVQFFTYRDFAAPKSEWESYYHYYSERLSGIPSAASEEYIEAEERRLAEISAQIADYYARYEESMAAALTESLQAELRPMQAFEAARAQYESLSAGQSYVYRSGYDRLFGTEGIRDDLANTMKLLFVLILVLSPTFAIEHETKLVVLQTTAGAQKRVRRRKLLLTAVVLLAAMTLAYLPQYLAIERVYGLPELGAAASSLTQFAFLPLQWSIRGVLFAIAGFRMILAAAAVGIVLFLSARAKSTIPTMLIGIGVLLLPLAVLLIAV